MAKMKIKITANDLLPEIVHIIQEILDDAGAQYYDHDAGVYADASGLFDRFIQEKDEEK